MRSIVKALYMQACRVKILTVVTVMAIESMGVPSPCTCVFRDDMGWL